MAISSAFLYHGRDSLRAAARSKGEMPVHIASYNVRGRSSFGVVVGDGIVDLRPRMAPRFQSVMDILRAGALDEMKAAAAGVRADFPLSECELLNPVPGGEKILCIGVNYAKRDGELTYAGGNEEAKYPSMFFKPPNALVGHGAQILRPPESEQLEYEGEIALVIGKTGRRIPKDKAFEHVVAHHHVQRGHDPRLDPARPVQRHPGQELGLRPAASGRG